MCSKTILDTLLSCKTKKEAVKLLGISVKNIDSIDSQLSEKLKEIGLPSDYFDKDVIKERELIEYIHNPKLCKCCGKEIPFEKRNRRIFCSSSCAAKYNNKDRNRTDESKKKTSESLRQRFRKRFSFNGSEYNLTPQEASKLYWSEEISIDVIKEHFPELIKICKNCNKEYVLRTNSYGNYTGGKHSLFCSVECAKLFQRRDSLLYESDASNRKRKIKRDYLNYRGGKCVVCGYDKCEYAMDFHHVYSWNKKDNITKYINQVKPIDYPGVKEELDKCVILCSTHHRELHAGMIDIMDYINIEDIPIN